MSEKSSKKPNGSRPTIDDVARTVGVSKTTISRYLSGQFDSIAEPTRKRIEEAITALNYRPNRMARGLKRDRSYLIGFVMADIMNPYSTSILRGAEEVCRKHGYNLLVCNTDNDPQQEKHYIYLLQAHRIDGLLINTTGYNNEILHELSKDYTSVVLVDRRVPELGFDMIGTDNLMATEEAMRFLLECGYERIAYFSERFGNTSTRLERARKFVEVLERHGHPSVRDVYEIDLQVPGQLELRLKEYLESSKGRFRAIFAGNGVIHLKIITALQNMGVHIPDDISMIGFDDPDWAPLVGSGITTIAHPTYQIGAMAMELVLKRIEGSKEPAQTIQLPARLVVRASTPKKKDSPYAVAAQDQ
jgi:LacI family kdg operon repressor